MKSVTIEQAIKIFKNMPKIVKKIDNRPMFVGGKKVDHLVTLTVSADSDEIDALRAKMEEDREKAGKISFDPVVTRTGILLAFQRKEYSLGAWHYTVAKNIYGYAVGDSLKSNISGGRWAQTPRGYTLAQAIAWGCQEARKKNVRFSLQPQAHDDLKGLL